MIFSFLLNSSGFPIKFGKTNLPSISGSTNSTVAFFEFVSTFIGTSNIPVGTANSIIFAIAESSFTTHETIIFVIARFLCGSGGGYLPLLMFSFCLSWLHPKTKPHIKAKIATCIHLESFINTLLEKNI